MMNNQRGYNDMGMMQQQMGGNMNMNMNRGSLMGPGPMGPNYNSGPMGPMGGNGGMMGPGGHQQQGMMGPQQGMMMGGSMGGQGMMGPNMGYGQGFNDGYGGGNGPMDQVIAGYQPIRVKDGCLVPPPPGAPCRTCRERPNGCRTVFIGGLPDNVTEALLRDIFCQFGPIVSCRLSKKNFAHIRYEREDSADYAIRFSGWNLCIGDDEDPSQKQNRIHVDYAMARDDQAEYDARQKEYFKELRAQMIGDDDTETVIQYSDREAAHLHEQLKANDTFSAATQILSNWLDRGDCTRRNASAFYSMTQTAHSHVRRMTQEKQAFVHEYTSMKERFTIQLQTILMQFEQIEKVFLAAQKQKVWDHFTKAQRKNLTAWHEAVKEAKKENTEFALKQREEDEMDLSDGEGDEMGPQSKKARMEGRQDTIHRLTEENDALRCQLESVRADIEAERQEMDDDLEQKESVVQYLKTALNNTQRQLLDAKQQIQKLQKEVRTLKGEPEPEVEEKSESEATEKKEASADEIAKQLADDSGETKPEEKEDSEVKNGDDANIDEVEMEEDDETKEKDELPESEKSQKKKRQSRKKAVKAEVTTSGEMTEMDRLMAQAKQYAQSTTEKQVTTAPKPGPRAGFRDAGRERRSGFKNQELKIIGLLSMFLNMHPYGASSDYICQYLGHLGIQVTPVDVDILLLKLPMLFYHDKRAKEGNRGQDYRLWCFVGFQAN